MSSQKTIEQLSAILAAGKFEPFVSYIRFPRYKNLAANFRIDFTFPITALVGPNGTNKSSILVALQGAPANRSPGQFWFSTKMDPIEETGDLPNSLVYGYRPSGAGAVVEVLKLRIADSEDPDLWETSRPIRRFGMEPVVEAAGTRQKTRQGPIRKSVVYLDFRQSLSAFDKVFYHSEPRRGSSNIQRKALIRSRSAPLLAAITEKAKNYVFARLDRIREKTNRELGADEVSAISRISRPQVCVNPLDPSLFLRRGRLHVRAAHRRPELFRGFCRQRRIRRGPSGRRYPGRPGKIINPARRTGSITASGRAGKTDGNFCSNR